MALGAAVAEAALGRHIGRRALLLGAALGTLPDLDVVIQYPDAIDAFTRHRGFSHSLFVLSLASIPIAMACRRRLDRGRAASAGLWCFAVWAVLITHALLDGFTVYGTQLFWPLPVPPVAVGSIFIIDPMYTLPMLFGLWFAWRWRDVRGRRANAVGLVVAQVWLLVLLVLQQVVQSDVLEAFEVQDVQASAVMILPLPTGLMWRVVAIEGDDVLESWVSLIDGSDEIRLDRLPRDLNRLGVLDAMPSVQRLRWFTRDFLALREIDGTLVLSDLRMGTATNPVFSFDVAMREGSSVVPMTARDRQIYFCPSELRQLLRRTVNAEPSMPLPTMPGQRVLTGISSQSVTGQTQAVQVAPSRQVRCGLTSGGDQSESQSG